MRFSDDAKTALPTRAQIQALYNGERGIDPAVPMVMDAGMCVAGALNVTATVTPWIILPHPALHYTISAFHCQPPSVHPLGIGTLSHEFGHSLGMGHLYDTGTSTSGTGNGIGNYDLMAYGNFGFDNIRHNLNSLSAYHKLFTGWVSYEDIIADGWYMIWVGIHQVYNITHSFPSVEYLLLETDSRSGTTPQ